ncbi:MAG: hypothetical protein AB7I27_09985 [Bacteriovoracaceae bacterium]
MKWSLLIVLQLIALASAMAEVKSAKEAIESLEKSGDLPKLNRDDSLQGPDLNHNDVRDDIEDIINKLPDTLTQKKALMRLSASITKAMITTDKSAADSISHASMCIAAAYPEAEVVKSKKRSDMVRAYTLNTTNRIKAYDKFSTAMNGMSFKLPIGKSCE